MSCRRKSVSVTRTLFTTLLEGNTRPSAYFQSVDSLRHFTQYHRNYDFSSVHVTGAKSIANIAAHHGISKFVHVSHLNASLDSKSHFYQTKAEGELAVREAFPESTIIRPSIMFGYEDRLLNNMAGM